MTARRMLLPWSKVHICTWVGVGGGGEGGGECVRCITSYRVHKHSRCDSGRIDDNQDCDQDASTMVQGIPICTFVVWSNYSKVPYSSAPYDCETNSFLIHYDTHTNNNKTLKCCNNLIL